MKLFWTILVCVLLVVAPNACKAEPEGVTTQEFVVDGVKREALVYVPKSLPTNGAKVPLVFGFHGHGGTSRYALNTFEFNRLWPEAISVYPQGLPTAGTLLDREGKFSGWQAMQDGLADRDLHFVDAMLARLQKDYPVDPKRIYCAGHSNGAGMTFLLWLTRSDVFAAFAPCSGAAIYADRLPPKPAIILGGRNDNLVKFEWQQRMMEAVKRVNACDAAGQPWEGGKGTLYPSKGGTPLVTYVYDGGHLMESGESEWIVKFFQQRPGPSAAGR